MSFLPPPIDAKLTKFKFISSIFEFQRDPLILPTIGLKSGKKYKRTESENKEIFMIYVVNVKLKSLFNLK